MDIHRHILLRLLTVAATHRLNARRSTAPLEASYDLAWAAGMYRYIEGAAMITGKYSIELAAHYAAGALYHQAWMARRKSKGGGS